ncbi:3-hydroxyacyl-CoA dehydrogenase NAD-binding domain-containing protein [Goodfellowiella coeruleoviolacea]|uniref:3-hydroxyacyl-CoA dehydrogenase / enoyl-CoA hydratase / 3-hydroxybutyryl-CoA epimerase n=1 Tax=Goodfellowiella coeruleoviolacea TaxID=334858 RepID=A0AAE3GER3_9PSEU|nr:3-hydroxyacyl-CoA dehydrogenase NAD-binding domain-containing protein [Goodfellowiella coeruleoviolacea]MCP2166383.1 3-hydroxyacyl-CoA dehydrogenase / enoyl-CoA hydratase / 3-hydroxybutyryl-CoA epimerase [Goodfellowiella coeruleoviolacea]
MSSSTTENAVEGIRYALDGADGIVTLTLDMPGSANVMNAAYGAAMGAAVDRLERERDSVRGVIITSAKKTFFAGGDLTVLIGVTEDNVEEFLAGLDAIKAQFRRLEQLGVPVVAALNGSALGGGWELALACHRRICLDADHVRIGLPEVTLGLLPGAGGVTRMVRLLGVAAALPLLAEGRQLRPAQALRAGLVHELAADHDDLLARARAWLLEHPDAAVQPWDQPGHTVPGFRIDDPDTRQLLVAAPAVLHKKTRGAVPAPEKILSAAVEGALVDFDTALAIERRYFRELVTSQVAKNMIGTFWFQLNEVKSGRSRPAGVERRLTRKLGVLGAGMMGAGIAQVSAQAGIDVVLKDVSEQVAAKGKDGIAARLDRRVEQGKLDARQRDEVLARIHPTGSDADLAGCDLVIEAVFEDRDLKGRVLSAAEATALPDAVIASNTSTLPITGLAAAVPAPDRFVGLHFFSPAHRMPLVEIIRGERTSDATLARAFDYVTQIGKTPIVVNDARGFYTSRTFATYITEGIAMVAEGVHPALVENVARKAGMAVGPLAVCDEVTLTLPLKIRQQTLADLADAPDSAGSTGPRGLTDHPAFDVLELMVTELGRPGRSGGAGFYDYPADGPKRLWPGLVERFTRPEAGVSEQDVRDRLLYAQALETLRCLDEGVLTSVSDANVGSILGLGYAPWTGGTVQFVNSVGLAEFVDRADYLADTYGERFRPPASLRERAARGERF